MAVATSTAIRRIIVREYKADNPAFAVIDLLQQALKKALALENLLSVDDVAPGRDVPTTRAQLMDTDTLPRRVLVTSNANTISTTGSITMGTANPITITAGDEMMNSDEYDRRYGNNAPHQGERSRQSESLHDQVLSALDQAVTRVVEERSVGVNDRMLAVVHAIPHLEAIYPDKAERDAVIQALRSEIQQRLGESMPPAELQSQLQIGESRLTAAPPEEQHP